MTSYDVMSWRHDVKRVLHLKAIFEAGGGNFLKPIMAL